MQTVTGVGPRLAQALLAVHSPDALRRAVMTEDLVALTKVPGVGRKGAQRLVLELKDRLGPPRGGHGGGSVDLTASRAPGRGVAGPGAHGAHRARLDRTRRRRGASRSSPPRSRPTPTTATPDVPALLKAALRSLSRA